MAEKQWSRYDAPDEPRDERGQSEADKFRARTMSRWAHAASASKTRLPIGWIIGITVAVVSVILVAAFAANDSDGSGGGDSGDEEATDRMFLDESLITESLEQAAGELEGYETISVSTSDYQLQVTGCTSDGAFMRTYEKSTYDEDGSYNVSVEIDDYNECKSRPIELAQVDADVLVQLGEAALDELADHTDDPADSWDVTAAGAGQEVAYSATAYASDEGEVEITADAEGNVTNTEWNDYD